MKAVRVRVTGRVQGVSFRAYCQQQARTLGVNGRIRNAADGSVTGEFEGDADAVDTLVDWCRTGPSHASVEQVDVEPVDPSGADGFSVD